MRTTIKSRIAKLEGRSPERIVSAREQFDYWRMMLKVYGDASDPAPVLEDFRDMPESEFLKPLFEIVDRVYAEPMPTP